jgi:hypothetical protein
MAPRRAKRNSQIIGRQTSVLRPEGIHLSSVAMHLRLTVGREAAPGYQERATATTYSQERKTKRDTTPPRTNSTGRYTTLPYGRRRFRQRGMLFFSRCFAKADQQSSCRIYWPPNRIKIKVESGKEHANLKNCQPTRQPSALGGDNQHPAQALLFGIHLAYRRRTALPTIRLIQSSIGFGREPGPRNALSKTTR